MKYMKTEICVMDKTKQNKTKNLSMINQNTKQKGFKTFMCLNKTQN